MDLPRLPHTLRTRVALLAVFWGVFGLVVAAHTYVTLHVRGVPYVPAYFVAGVGGGLAWIGLTPVVARLARRFPPVGRGWPTRAVLHAVVAAVFNAGVTAAIVLTIAPFDADRSPFGATFGATALSNSLFFELVYFGVVAAVLAYDASRSASESRERAREREVRAAQLEGQLAGARLDALRMQLNPHFLFNTLHAVAALMESDIRAARKVIADLSGLLRVALDRVSEPEVPLADELDFLGHYLAIEQARFRDRLDVRHDIAPGLGDALVPNLLLQPLVENALKHGVARQADGGRVEIGVRREPTPAGGDVLVLTVTDDGPGLPHPPDVSADRSVGASGDRGVGLRNTRERLERLYGDGHAFELRARAGGGLIAEVRIPYHTLPLPPL